MNKVRPALLSADPPDLIRFARFARNGWAKRREPHEEGSADAHVSTAFPAARGGSDHVGGRNNGGRSGIRNGTIRYITCAGSVAAAAREGPGRGFHTGPHRRRAGGVDRLLQRGNVWIAATDGSNAHQVTTGGSWLYADMADNGTIVAEGPGEQAPDGTTGMDLYVMDQSGHVDHKMTTPSDYSSFSFPAYPPTTVRISPDAQKIAYYNFEGDEDTTLWTPTSSTNLNFPGQTLGQENNIDPSWIDSTDLLLDDPSAWECYSTPPDRVFKTYKTGNGDDTAASWFDDTTEAGGCYQNGWATGFDSTISRQGAKIAVVEDNAADNFDGQPTKVVIRLFATNGPAPTKPTFKCQVALNAAKYNTDKGGLWVGYASPTFTADGTELAWGDADGIHVANVSNLANCSSITPSLLIAGAALPSFSAATIGSQQSPSITLSKSSGPPGTSVTATGAAFGPNETVKLTFLDSAGHKTSLGSATADGTGAFTKNVTIPASAPLGKGKVQGKGATSGLKAHATFKVM